MQQNNIHCCYDIKNSRIFIGKYRSGCLDINYNILKDNEILKGDYIKFKEVWISKDISLDKSILDHIIMKVPTNKMVVFLEDDKGNNDISYNEQETISLVKNINYIVKHDIDVEFHENSFFDSIGYDLNEIIKTNRQINRVVNLINQATNKDGNPLSNVEKFICAYEYVVNRFKYRESPKKDPFRAREVISVMNGDRVVCVGYAMTLCEILNKLEIGSTEVGTKIGGWSGKLRPIYNKGIHNPSINHSEVLVRIKDDKYNIDGIYLSDPTNEKKEKALITNSKIRKDHMDYICADRESVLNFNGERDKDIEDLKCRLKEVSSIEELNDNDREILETLLDGGYEHLRKYSYQEMIEIMHNPLFTGFKNLYNKEKFRKTKKVDLKHIIKSIDNSLLKKIARIANTDRKVYSKKRRNIKRIVPLDKLIVRQSVDLDQNIKYEYNDIYEREKDTINLHKAKKKNFIESDIKQDEEFEL